MFSEPVEELIFLKQTRSENAHSLSLLRFVEPKNIPNNNLLFDNARSLWRLWVMKRYIQKTFYTTFIGRTVVIRRRCMAPERTRASLVSRQRLCRKSSNAVECSYVWRVFAARFGKLRAFGIQIFRCSVQWESNWNAEHVVLYVSTEAASAHQWRAWILGQTLIERAHAEDF